MMHPEKLMFVFIIITSLILTAGSSSRSTVLLTAQDSGKKVRLHQEQKMQIELEGNPTTGFQWIVAQIDSSVITQTGRPTVQPIAERAGAPAVITFEFQAQNQGEFEIVMHYKRVWEKDVAPLDSVIVSGKVK